MPLESLQSAAAAGAGPAWAADAGDPVFARAHELDARLTGLVAGVAPLRRALARLAGRMVAGRAWERLGYARGRDWAAERAGISGEQLYELARGAAVLERLPGVEAAFLAGTLGWTKLRLLGRVVTPQDEGRWLARAAGLSADALSREVRAVDRRSLEQGGGKPDPEDADARPRETLVLRCTRREQGRWFFARQVAQRFAGQRLGHADTAELIAAEVLSAIGLEVEPESEPAAQRPGSGPLPGRAPARVPTAPPGPMDAAAAPGTFVDSLLEGLDEADPFELDARLRRALALERRGEARLAPGLLELAEGRLYRDLGFRSFDAYVKERLGIAPSQARALLRLERTGVLSPAFRQAWREGRLTWSQAHALVPLVVLDHSRPWHADWIARAGAVTVRRLEEDVDRAVASGDLGPASLPQVPTGLPIGDGAMAAESALGPKAVLFFTVPRDVARLFRAVLATVQRRIERHTGRPASAREALAAMLDHALEAWGHGRPLPKKYAVFQRDGFRCVVPGCTGYRNLQEHHVVFRSQGGGEELENRVTLCAWHHLRGVHAGRVRIAGPAPEGLRFELGLRSGARPLVVYTAGDFARPPDSPGEISSIQ